MIRIHATRQMPASADRVWDLLTNWENHSRWVPGTDVKILSMPEGPDKTGATFVGRSHLGPFGFDDPMTVTVFRPPTSEKQGRCEIVKTGKVITGTAGFAVVAVDPVTSLVHWWEDVEVTPARLTKYLDPFVSQAGSKAFTKVLGAAALELLNEK